MFDIVHSRRNSALAGSLMTMPRYFFDIDDMTRAMKDDVGSDLANLAEAHREAAGTLIQMGRDVFRDGSSGSLSVIIRDESGAVLRKVWLTLSIGD
jgi:hypothetical protein